MNGHAVGTESTNLERVRTNFIPSFNYVTWPHVKKNTGTSLRIVSSCVTHACNALMAVYQQIACRHCPLCGTSFIGPWGGASPYETELSLPRAYQMLH